MKSTLARLCALSLYVLLLVSASAQAARLDTLFQAEVDAGGRDSAARDAALRRALQLVLVRVSGNSEVLRQPEAATLLRDPGRYVQQYRFRQQAPAAGGQGRKLKLWVQFDGVALSKDMRRLGLPYWGRERPDVLVWLAVDDRGRRYLVAEGSDSAAAVALRRAAAARGLPLTLPLMDLQDQRAVQFTDVWGGFVGTVQAASQRYRPQVILVGRISRSGSGGWRGRWNMLAGGDNEAWTTHAENINAVVEGGVADATRQLALRYALVSEGDSVYPLVVEGVRNLEDYARVSHYLASLSPVEQVQVAQVNGDEVEFSLRLSSGERSLLQLISLGRTLQALDDPVSLRFRLNP